MSLESGFTSELVFLSFALLAAAVPFNPLSNKA
jgi:hypothetical protein